MCYFLCVFFVILHYSLLDDRSTGYVEMATVGAFLLEVYALRGIACRELARLQDLMEEAAVRTPEQASLNLNDFKVRFFFSIFFPLRPYLFSYFFVAGGGGRGEGVIAFLAASAPVAVGGREALL